LVEEIADRVAEKVLTRLVGAPIRDNRVSPFVTVTEAAAYLRCDRQRIDDLLSARRLRRFKDGRRTLVARDELERYVSPDD
jgi:excisionase family DNA binding protein